MTRTTRLLPLVLLPLLVAGCGGGDGAAAAPETTVTATETATETAPATAPPSGTSSAAACAPTSETVPDGAATAPVDTTTLPDGGDLTGDPANGPATLWISSTDAGGGDRRLGVVTGSGAVSSVPIESAGPVGTTALAANLDGAGPVEVLLDDNRTTWLYAVVDCALQPVLGPDGQQFEFDRGFRGNGTGVGCSPTAADGTRSLLGLELDSGAGTVTATEIPLDGLTAGIGSSSAAQLSQDAATSVSCDALTMAANGLAEPGQG